MKVRIAGTICDLPSPTGESLSTCVNGGVSVLVLAKVPQPAFEYLSYPH